MRLGNNRSLHLIVARKVAKIAAQSLTRANSCARAVLE